MTQYSFADLPDWAAKVGRIADAVVSQATNDMMDSVDSAPGIVRGGSRTRGVIPIMDGAIVSSLQSSLNGSTAIDGQTGYALIAGRMVGGDIARFSWGGAAAPHARANHYGFGKTKGTFWVDVMTRGWSTKWVPGALARAKAEIR